MGNPFDISIVPTDLFGNIDSSGAMSPDRILLTIEDTQSDLASSSSSGVSRRLSESCTYSDEYSGNNNSTSASNSNSNSTSVEDGSESKSKRKHLCERTEESTRASHRRLTMLSKSLDENNNVVVNIPALSNRLYYIDVKLADDYNQNSRSWCALFGPGVRAELTRFFAYGSEARLSCKPGYSRTGGSDHIH